MEGRYHPRKQGDFGELSAIEWLGSHGYALYLPLGHSPDVDLIAERDGRLCRVQVKTSTVFRNQRWGVMVATRGGNRSWTGVAKYFSAERCDHLFVHVADGRRWFIPACEVDARSGLNLGGPKYARYEVEPWRPLPSRVAA
jgi:Holliday junction resolvase-like predicted endonuclease